MIPFIDLQAQYKALKPRIDARIQAVLDHGAFIHGPEVAEFEKELSQFLGVKHTIACANGTDAIALALMALNIKPGQIVFVPSFTFCATAEVVVWMGAIPYFVDVDPATFDLCPKSLEDAIAKAKQESLEPVGIIAVDLFGHPAEYTSLKNIAEANDLWLIGDSAQGLGCQYHGETVASQLRLSTTSFFPAKPLGCYGDGGAVFTDDDNIAEILKSLRVHGKGTDKYDNVRIGMNSRLDTLQASILLEKLAVYTEEIESRNRIANIYAEKLQNIEWLLAPKVADCCTSVWAQYTLTLDSTINRDALQTYLKKNGIPSAVYYPKPLHLQTAYAKYPKAASLENSENLANKVLSLPIHPRLGYKEVVLVVDALMNYVK